MDNKYKSFLTEGHEDEKMAMQLIENTIGGKCFIPNNENDRETMDRICHVDFFWKSPKGYLCSIDKKMQKKKNRKDDEYMKESTWIELYGNTGKLGSSAPHANDVKTFLNYDIKDNHDYLMVESPNSYLFIQRNKLFEFVANKIKGTKLVYETPDKDYVPYQRKKYGHKDISVMVPFKDLETIMQFKINK